jgi:hypothetical protein
MLAGRIGQGRTRRIPLVSAATKVCGPLLGQLYLGGRRTRFCVLHAQRFGAVWILPGRRGQDGDEAAVRIQADFDVVLGRHGLGFCGEILKSNCAEIFLDARSL